MYINPTFFGPALADPNEKAKKVRDSINNLYNLITLTSPVKNNSYSTPFLYSTQRFYKYYFVI